MSHPSSIHPSPVRRSVTALLLLALAGSRPAPTLAADVPAGSLELLGQVASVAGETPPAGGKLVLPVPEIPRAERDPGRKNPCGPYAVTAVLRYAGRDEADFSTIARAMTPDDKLGTGPLTLLRALLDGRLNVSAKNGGDAGDLVAALRQGNPAIILMDAGGTPHWAVVKGCVLDDGEPVAFFLEDSFFASGARSRGRTIPDGYRMERDELVRLWDRPIVPGEARGLLNWAAGYKRYVAVAHVKGPGGSRDIPLDAVSPASMLYTGFTDLLIGIREQSPAGFLAALGELASGAWLGIPFVAGGVLRRAGQGLAKAGSWIRDHTGPAGLFLGGPLQLAGGAVEGAGGAITGLARKGLGAVGRIFG